MAGRRGYLGMRKHGTASGVAVPVFAGGFAMVGGGVGMTRVARVVVPEGPHHITQRGNNRTFGDGIHNRTFGDGIHNSLL